MFKSVADLWSRAIDVDWTLLFHAARLLQYAEFPSVSAIDDDGRDEWSATPPASDSSESGCDDVDGVDGADECGRRWMSSLSTR